MMTSSKDFRTIYLSQVQGILSSEQTVDPYAEARALIHAWAKERLQQPLSPEDAPSIDEINAERCVRFCAQQSKDIWACQFSQTDEANRKWIVESTLLRDQGQTHFGTNLLCSLPYDAPDPIASVPSFIKALLENPGLQVDGRQLSKTFQTVQTEADAESLYEFLMDPTRKKPVFVISLKPGQSSPEEAIVSPSRAAESLCPLAHVFVIRPAASWALADYMGSKWSVYGGAIRTYNPGLDPKQDDLFSHPLILEETAANWRNGEKGLIGFLFQNAARLSVGGSVEQRVPSFSAARQTILHQVRREQMEALSGKTLSLEAENAQLKEDSEILTGMIDDLQKRVQTLEKELVEAGKQIVSLSAERETLLTVAENKRKASPAKQEEDIIRAWEREGPALTKGLPKTLKQLDSWVKENLSDRLVLLPRAASEARTSDFGDPELVYKSLLLLSCEYRDMILNGTKENREKFQNRLNALHLTNSKSCSSPPSKTSSPYFASYEGKRLLLDMHLKKGTSRNPRDVLRIYYAFDQNSRRPIVGHLPTHLDNALS